MAEKHTVLLKGQRYIVDVSHREPLWFAMGNVMDAIIETKGPSAAAALVRWKVAASKTIEAVQRSSQSQGRGRSEI
jgi:hypothetical protein